MCFYCKNATLIDAYTTHVVTLEHCLIVVKNVPCQECELCGHKYFVDEVMEQLELIVNQAKALASEIFVTEYSHQVA